MDPVTERNREKFGGTADAAAEASTAIATVEENKGLSMFLGDAAGAMHNFTGSAMEKWRMSAIAAGSTVKSGEEMLGQVIEIRYWFVHQVQIAGKDEDGYIDTYRVVLFDEDGTPYQFVSEGILAGLDRLLRFFGKGKLDPPIKVIPTKKKTRKGRQFFTLEPAPE